MKKSENIVPLNSLTHTHIIQARVGFFVGTVNNITQYDNSNNIIFVNYINLISLFYKKLKINIIFINFIRNKISILYSFLKIL